MAMGLGVEIHYHNALRTPDAKAFLEPMVGVGRLTASMVLRRVPRRGIGPRGPLPMYEEEMRSVLTKGGRERIILKWVPRRLLGRAAGKGIGVSSRGNEAFLSYAAYKRARGETHRTLKYTGNLWRGLRVRVMSMTKTKLAFMGRSKKGLSNRQLGGIQEAWAGQKILGINDREVRRVAKFVEDTFPAGYIDAAMAHQAGFSAERKLAAAERALKQAKKLHKEATASLNRGM